MKRKVGLAGVVVLLMAGWVSGDPAGVGELFAAGSPQALAGLKLMDEVNRLEGLGKGYEAQALVKETLRRYPVHGECFEAVDWLVGHVGADRSAPDDDRRALMKEAYELGEMVSEAVVKLTEQKDSARGIEAQHRGLEYRLRAEGETLEARREYVQAMTELVKKQAGGEAGGSLQRELVEAYMETGEFARAAQMLEEMRSAGVRVDGQLLGRCYYELGEFAKAVTYLSMGGGGRGGRRTWRLEADLVAKAYQALGEGAELMKRIEAGALVRRSDVWLHIEREWQETPRLRAVDRPDGSGPAGLAGRVDVQLELKSSYQTSEHDLTAGSVLTGKVEMRAGLDPVTVPRGTTGWKISLLTPGAFDTTVPYGSVEEQEKGFRSTWRGEFRTTADDWVTCATLWARSVTGRAKGPTVNVWRRSRPLGDNRVSVQVYVVNPAASFVTIDQPNALIDELTDVPEGATVSGNKSIYIKAPALAAEPSGKMPEKPFCSYVARVFGEVRGYYPQVAVLSGEPATFETTGKPADTQWSMDVEGNRLDLEFTIPVTLGKASLSSTTRWELPEMIERE